LKDVDDTADLSGLGTSGYDQGKKTALSKKPVIRGNTEALD